MTDQLLAEFFQLMSLNFSLNHDFALLQIILLVVAVIGYSIQHQSITRGKSNEHSIVGEGISQELRWVHFSVEDLDHRTHHFSDLVVQEGLTSEVKVNELKCSLVISRCDFKCVLVNVHELTCLQL
jgi:hypothetical protein